ncbi:hypothetical protein O9G_003251 [Rozella allomycis CSF55]|uniref:CDT1 Geminin-binding domain-containing protein n=1 Tax=Rozella allomycis (strain CSF55) TaxID=988480 RepID=A0A075AT92_ROZAC|nr:hypothetical protein O9G_003251 [Rozella allomycis CSF55]|eukprot:EPZ33390.1 hypothetical protein O9G_003251 [Rozella allomycis CSF55]
MSLPSDSVAVSFDNKEEIADKRENRQRQEKEGDILEKESKARSIEDKALSFSDSFVTKNIKNESIARKILETSDTHAVKPKNLLESDDKIPAYKKYAHLKVPNLTKVSLPERLESLYRIFMALDSTVSFVSNRGETCIFHKMKKPIENVCRKNVNEGHLKQIKTVYPEGYIFEPVKVMFEGKRTSSHAIQFNKNIESVTDEEAKRAIQSGEFLYKRKALFEKRLKTIWINKSEIPETQLYDVDVNSSNKSQQSIPISAKSDLDKNVEEKENALPAENKKLSLLERVRLKEKARLEKESNFKMMKEKPDLFLLSSLMDALYILFLSKRKTSLFIHEVLQSLSQNPLLGLSYDESKKEIEKLEKLLPDWISSSASGNGVVVKLKTSEPLIYDFALNKLQR